MPSLDINGKPIIILSEEEAKHIYKILLQFERLNKLETQIINKIARDLNLNDT